MTQHPQRSVRYRPATQTRPTDDTRPVARPVLPAAAALVVALGLQACSDSNYDFDQSIADQAAAYASAAPPQALYNPDPSAPQLPFPTSLFFQGSEDGTLNLPVTDPDNLADPRVALNLADGFSTSAPIVTSVSEPLDAETLVPGETVRVFEVSTVPLGETGGGAVTGVLDELDASQFLVTGQPSGGSGDDADTAATAGESHIIILPLQPLKPASDYMVLLTSGIEDVDGNALTASLPYRLTTGQTALTGDSVAPLEPLRQLNLTMLAAAAAQGVDTDSVVLSWTFKTIGVREVLQAVKDVVQPGRLQVASTNTTTANYPGGTPGQLPGLADVYTGTLDVPYYQTAVGEDGNPLPALSSYWRGENGATVSRYNPLPQATGTETIPVLMTVPNASAGAGEMPASGWPVAIMQHGITGNRTNALFIADAMAAAGVAVIAIDLPMHGITDPDNLLSATASGFADDRERTFGIDVLNNESGAAEPDQVPDDSGVHFYNLANLANTRDNVRQAVSDLLVLSASLGSIEGVTVDAGNKRFIGHSLGAIVGVPFLSYEPTVTAATLANPGSVVAQILANSATFGPAIAAGLQAQGIQPDSAEAQQFLTVAQTLADPGDPLNHAPFLAESGTALHYIEVLNDATVPNRVATAPLAGTEPLGRVLGLAPTASSTAGSGWFVFNSGDHSSFLDPSADPAVTVEMQGQAARFAASNGSILSIENEDVIQAP